MKEWRSCSHKCAINPDKVRLSPGDNLHDAADWLTEQRRLVRPAVKRWLTVVR